MTVYPGLIDSEIHLGLTEIEADKMTNDLVEPSDEIMPHMHVSDAFHAETALIPVTRYNGITNAIVAPESRDTLPGQDSFIQLAGADATQMLLVRDIAMPLNFTGKQRRNESFATASYPQTRMGMAAQMRQAFTDAQGYAAKWDEYNKKKAAAKAGDAPPISAVARPEAGSAASLPRRQEAGGGEGRGAQRRGDGLRAGAGVQAADHPEWPDAVAGDLRQDRAVEAAGDPGLDLR